MASPVEEAVRLEELEGIDRPVFLAGFHHVEMADQKDRFALAGAAKPRDHVAFAVVGAEHHNVARGESGVLEALGHCFGCDGGTANRIGRVDFDELLEDVARKLAGGVGYLGASREPGQQHQGKSEGTELCARRAIRVSSERHHHRLFAMS
jgi:hypothetical protein